MNCFWRTKIVCFTSFMDQFNPRKWKRSLKVKNFEVVNSVAWVAIVSSRVIARKVEREEKKMEGGKGGEKRKQRFLLSPPPPPSFLFFWFSSKLSRRTRAETLAMPAMNSAICAIFTLCQCKHLAAGRWSDFPSKNLILKYFQKLMQFQLLFDQDKFMGKV